MLPEPIQVTLRVTSILEELAVPYFIGGSLATAVHGVARSTMDVDIVADLKLEQVDRFVASLSGEFYIDDEVVRDAIRRQRSFNAIHLATMFKVDVFVRSQQPFDRSQYRRRVFSSLTVEPGHNAYVASPEDNILAKLDWYRKGGEVSDRQWRDITNVISIQGDRLDFEYLRFWATRLGVTDLLERALN